MGILTFGFEEDTDFIRSAAEFFSQKLLSKQKQKNLRMTILFTPMDKYEGYFIIRPANKIVEILISKGHLTKLGMLRALAHEFVHARQYLNGEMKFFIKNMKDEIIIFNDQILEKTKLTYDTYPWEIEAKLAEEDLIKSFIATDQKYYELERQDYYQRT